MKATARQHHISLSRLCLGGDRILVYQTCSGEITAVRFDGSVSNIGKVGIVYPFRKGKTIDVEFLEEKE